MIYSRIMLVWQSRSSFVSFIQKQRLSTQPGNWVVLKEADYSLYCVLLPRKPFKGLFYLFKIWKDLQPALPACGQPLCVSCVPLPVACAVELMLKGVIWMSAHWPSSLFVLAVTFSLCLCQDYALCWVLALVSQGRVTLRYLLAAGTKCGAWQILQQATERPGYKEWSRSAGPLPLPFSLITYSFKRAKLDFCIWIYPREVDFCSTFVLPFYNSSS